MMGVLKLGYGSSWTLNPKGFNAPKEPAVSVTSEPATRPADGHVEPEQSIMQELDPAPDVSDTDQDETPFVQRLEQSIGTFLIGLSGDLENTEFEDDPSEDTVSGDSSKPQRKAQRLFMRTLN
ncbi:MAG: hypothetical protein M1823_008241, partial [Watsoniomyces obsoletus]